MADTPFTDHWLEIDAERLKRYEEMFQWNPTTEHFYDAAQIGQGQTVGDFGCGPGHAAIEFARRVGPSGHVHAFDINEAFVSCTRKRARSEALDSQITVHLLKDETLPLADRSLDRMIARNTIIYVPDPVATFAEFRRVLRPNGIAHAIEGDWTLTTVEPLTTVDWQAIIAAASWAWPHPEIGRRLHAIARKAGFNHVSLQVLTSPDTEGRLLGMIRTVIDYARDSGKLDSRWLDSALKTIEAATKEKTYLAISPQFIVTATV